MPVMYGTNGKAITTHAVLDAVLSTFAEQDENYYAVTHIGKCNDDSQPCDCLRCTHNGMTIIQYTLNGQIETAYFGR